MKGEYSNLLEQVLKQIGINLLLLQQIEKGLKFIIPFTSHPNADPKNIDEIKRQRKSVKAQTLGSLVNTFLESADYHDYFAEIIKKIVAERNKLVHHFGEEQGLNILSNEESCKNCLTQLKEQHQEITFFYKEIRLYMSTVLFIMKENYGESHPQLERLYNDLRQSVISGGVEYINLLDPSDTACANTRIVKLLQLAELNTEKTDDMTLLAKAGVFIKKIDPECTPKEYAVKNLKEVLKVSGLFEVREIQNGQQSSILYKSKTINKEVEEEMEYELNSEYDFAQMEGGVRGKYIERYRTQTGFKIEMLDEVEAYPQFGSAKGFVKMSDDFDEPLADFEDYAP